MHKRAEWKATNENEKKKKIERRQLMPIALGIAQLINSQLIVTTES